jgi:hypothetical protein
LNAFDEACRRAEKASEAASLRQAINSIQTLRVELGMADNKPCTEYLQALNSRLYAIQQVTTTMTKFTDEEQTAAKNAIEALKSIEASLNANLANIQVDAGVKTQLKEAVEKQSACLSRMEGTVNTGVVQEPNDAFNKRSACYDAVLNEVQKKRRELLKEQQALNEERAKKNAQEVAVLVQARDQKAADAIRSNMPNHDEIWACMLSSAPTAAKQLQERGLVTAIGKNVFLELQQDGDLKTWLKNAVVVGGRTDVQPPTFFGLKGTPNRFELSISSAANGPQEASVIFFLEGNRIKFHDIWVKQGVLGRDRDTFISSENR